MEYTVCFKCKTTKSISDFYMDKSKRNGRTSSCKDCCNLAHRAWSKAHPERERAITRTWQKANPEKVKIANRAWEKANPEKSKAIIRAWYKANPEKIAIYRKKRRSTSQGRLNHSLSTGIYHSLRGNKRNCHWEIIVGYTIEQLKKHLEKQFQIGMTWENYGKWHIDHCIPISVFNFEKPEDIDFKKAWSLKNLQPMWAKDNMSKCAKLNKPFQPALMLAI